VRELFTAGSSIILREEAVFEVPLGSFDAVSLDLETVDFAGVEVPRTEVPGTEVPCASDFAVAIAGGFGEVILGDFTDFDSAKASERRPRRVRVAARLRIVFMA